MQDVAKQRSKLIQVFASLTYGKFYVKYSMGLDGFRRLDGPLTRRSGR